MENKKTKQVIVMRKDLNMRRGKQMSQAAHASMKVLLDAMDVECGEHYENWTLKVPNESALQEWLNGAFTKICLGTDSEEDLDFIFSQAKEAGLPCAMIIDNGLTEFNGVKTKTCIAIGPAEAEEIDKLTWHLKLL